MRNQQRTNSVLCGNAAGVTDNVRVAGLKPEDTAPLEKLGASGPLAAQDGELVAERYHLELQFYAAAKPTAEP